MQQLEIQYFYPLTEQINLELDYNPSEEWKKKQFTPVTIGGNGNLLIGNGGTLTRSQPLTSTFVIKPSEKNVGKWEITDHMFVYRPTKPNAVIRFMAKQFFGFKWHDEI